jgi:hypothetical protein
VESVRIIIYRTNLFKHKINSVIRWKNKNLKKFRNVFKLELKNLLNHLWDLIQSLPAPTASSREIDEWTNPRFFQWLQISYYIKPIQCQPIDWDEFFKKGGVFEKAASELGQCLPDIHHKFYHVYRLAPMGQSNRTLLHIFF